MLRMALCASLAGALLFSLSGCGCGIGEFQGGASDITIGSKLLSNPEDPPIGQLNPDEWQYVAQNAERLASLIGQDLPPGTNIPEVSDQEAQAIVDFLDANNIENVSDLDNIAGQLESGELEVPPALADLALAIGVEIANAQT